MEEWIVMKYDLLLSRIKHYENDTIVNDGYGMWYQENFELYWTLVSVTAFFALVAAVGSATVIFTVITKNHVSARFHYLNHAVLSLAVADFMFALCGTSFFVVYWYWSKSKFYPYPLW